MAENRRKRIETLLNKIRMDATTTVEEMSRFFGVSPATIRRDIKVLEEERYVIRTVGGGIVYKKDLSDSHIQPSSIPFVDEKIRIAEYCTEIVQDLDEIIVGPGTTTFLAGKILSGITDRKFRIITNSLELALETASVPNIRTVILGGEVRNRHSVGFEAHMDYFDSCHTRHKLLLSADGVDIANGLTLSDSHFLTMLRKMIGVSTQIILLADSSKIGKVCFNHLADLSCVTLFVTDTHARDEFCAEVRQFGIEVVRL
jgi:DeoR family transcriptional regulator, aga operon transcriptional repressor